MTVTSAGCPHDGPTDAQTLTIWMRSEPDPTDRHAANGDGLGRFATERISTLSPRQ